LNLSVLSSSSVALQQNNNKIKQLIDFFVAFMQKLSIMSLRTRRGEGGSFVTKGLAPLKNNNNNKKLGGF